jgi:hypothetical protein
MASVMQMRWDGVTPDQYDALRPIVRWENDSPEGAIFHVAWFDGGGINVIDVWDSPEQFDRFMQDRLMPGVQQVGVQGQPDVTWSKAHAIFNPQAEKAGVAA